MTVVKAGRLNLVPISWQAYNLRDFLKLRLSWASDGLIQSIAQLCDETLLSVVNDVDQELIRMALVEEQLGPPLALLDLGSRLLQQLTQKDVLLSYRDWDNFLQHRDLKNEEAQSFFKEAGFTTKVISPFELLCISNLLQWRNISPLYIQLLSELGVDEASALLKGVKKAFGTTNIQDRIVIILIDRQPQPGVLHQIFALRTQVGLIVVPLPYSSLFEAQLNRNPAATLKDKIDLYSGRVDLYNLKNAVTDILSFFGRNSLLSNLQKQLMSGKSVIVFGIRKIGKSSLLGRFQQEFVWPVALVNLEYHKGRLESIYGDALYGWQVALKNKYPNLRLPQEIDKFVVPYLEVNASDFHHIVIRLLKLLETQPGRPGLLLFLDELDILFKETEYYDFATVLHSIAENPQCRGRFAILVAGLSPELNRRDQLSWRHQGSFFSFFQDRIVGRRNPFFSFFLEEPIGPLNSDDTRIMIESIGNYMTISYEGEALDRLIAVGGGHPFLTRQLCSQAIRNLDGSKRVNLAHVIEAEQRYLHQADNYFAESLWAIDSGGPPPAEAMLLTALATAQPQTEELLIPSHLPTKDRRARQLALTRLQDLSLIRRVPNGWQLTISLYRDWIRRNILNLPNETTLEEFQ